MYIYIATPLETLYLDPILWGPNYGDPISIYKLLQLYIYIYIIL